MPNALAKLPSAHLNGLHEAHIVAKAAVRTFGSFMLHWTSSSESTFTFDVSEVWNASTCSELLRVSCGLTSRIVAQAMPFLTRVIE
eukprot:6001781-Amphidinium_carterae.1